MKRVLFAALLLGSAAAQAASFSFDASNSTLGFTGNYGGEDVVGGFKRFSGTAQFDLSAPLATRFKTEIDVASLDSDYADRDETLRGAEFFDTGAHPKAVYESTGDCVAAAAKFTCPGNLTLRGVTKPVALTIAPTADGSHIEGTATLDRSQFGVGSGEWADPETIANVIAIRFNLKLAAK